MAEKYDFQSPVNNITGGALTIDIARMGKAMFQKMWAMVMVGVIIAGAFYLFAKNSYVPYFTTNAKLGFNTTTYITGVDDEGNPTKPILVQKFYTSNDIARYQTYITADKMIQTIYENLDSKYSKDDIRGSIIVSQGDVNGILIITVSNPSVDFCREVINVIINIFPDYLRTFDSSLGIEILNWPRAPVATNSDGSTQKGVYGFLIGVLIVALLVFITEMLTDTIRSVEDVRNKTNAKTLGAVPYIEPSKKQRAQGGRGNAISELLMTEDNSVNFAFSETFKSIRTKIENIAIEKSYKVFAITSTFEDEGKTTVTLNIASTLAQKGKSVLVIDCDMRKPAVLLNLGMKEKSDFGLIPIIQGQSTYTDSIKYVKNVGFYVLPAGGYTMKSTELLDVDRVKAVFDQARSEFDYVIIDTPPARVVTDCMVLASLVDSIIFAVRSDYAKISHINDTMEELAATDADIIGVVLTMAAGEGLSKYYSRRSYRYRKYHNKYGYGKYGYGYYGYYGQDGYGYGYGNEKNSDYGYGGYGYGYSGRRKDRTVIKIPKSEKQLRNEATHTDEMG